MARRPTISDLAGAAGVSVATVDRVLNGRHPVREETARRVLKAANALGYHAAGLIRQRLHGELQPVKLGFVLRKPRQYFYQALARELQAAVAIAPGIRGTAAIEFGESASPTDAAARLLAMGARAQAVALVAQDHPAVTAAVETLKAKGVPVFALLSDFGAGIREGYVGLNNRKAGRTAGWMIATAAKRPGKVAVFFGSHRFQGQELREIGLRAFFRESAPEFEVIETAVNLEARQIVHEATLALLDRCRDLVGLYVAGGGMEGAIAALREAGAGRGIAVVVNEITPESRAALADGVITLAIATPVAALCRELVQLMLHAIRHGAAEAPGQIFLPFELHTPENI